MLRLHLPGHAELALAQFLDFRDVAEDRDDADPDNLAAAPLGQIPGREGQRPLGAPRTRFDHPLMDRGEVVDGIEDRIAELVHVLVPGEDIGERAPHDRLAGQAQNLRAAAGFRLVMTPPVSRDSTPLATVSSTFR